MTGIQAIGVLVIRLWGAWAAFCSLGGLASLFERESSNSNESAYFVWTLVESDVGIAVGLLAWFFAPEIARRVLPATTSEPIALSVGVDEIVAAGSFLIGGNYIVQFLPKLAGRFAKSSSNSQMRRHTGRRRLRLWTFAI